MYLYVIAALYVGYLPAVSLWLMVFEMAVWFMWKWLC